VKNLNFGEKHINFGNVQNGTSVNINQQTRQNYLFDPNANHEPTNMEKTVSMNEISQMAKRSNNTIRDEVTSFETNNNQENLPIYGPVIDPTNKATYTGQFRLGKKEGMGKEVYKNGSVYKGNW